MNAVDASVATSLLLAARRIFNPERYRTGRDT
jgi:hypothetical protein